MFGQERVQDVIKNLMIKLAEPQLKPSISLRQQVQTEASPRDHISREDLSLSCFLMETPNTDKPCVPAESLL